MEPVSGSMELSELSLLFPPPLLLVLMSPLISLLEGIYFTPFPDFLCGDVLALKWRIQPESNYVLAISYQLGKNDLLLSLSRLWNSLF